MLYNMYNGTLENCAEVSVYLLLKEKRVCRALKST